MSDASELFAAAHTALINTMTAQSYDAPGGRRKQMADLEKLARFRRELLDEVDNQSAESMASLCELCDPT
jgi:hypothetical protein